MGDLKNGLNEIELIEAIKTVLLQSSNPRGGKANENLKWLIRQYRKRLDLFDVINLHETGFTDKNGVDQEIIIYSKNREDAKHDGIALWEAKSIDYCCGFGDL